MVQCQMNKTTYNFGRFKDITEAQQVIEKFKKDNQGVFVNI